MWCCCFLMRNGWMLHFLHLFHKFSPTLSILQTLTFLQTLQNNLLHPSWLFLTWNGWDHKCVRILFSNIGIIFIWDILCEPHIYIIWKQICLHVLAFDCDLSVGLIWNFPRGVMLALSSFQFCSFLKLWIFRRVMLK